MPLSVLQLVRFQSTSSARRTTHQVFPRVPQANISIHVLREEDDCPRTCLSGACAYFNPRPPRGGRPPARAHRCCQRKFQSTSSARRTTQDGHRGVCRRYDFNPRPPRGGRRDRMSLSFKARSISIHVLREEDDILLMVSMPCWLFISIHVLREEDDRQPN